MSVHNIGGERVVVTPIDRNWFFYRTQGISVEVSPRRRWWCLWICTTTTDVDSIQCFINLTGAVKRANANDSCADCGSLTVTGPDFWGFSVPRAFDRVSYSGSIKKGSSTFSFEGSEIFF